MSNKFALYCNTALIILDVILIWIIIKQPAQDRVHGGLGQGLFVFYGLGVILTFLLIEASFLILYFREKFVASKVICWLLIAVNIISVILWIAMALKEKLK